MLINGFPAGDPQYLPTLTQMLEAYADALRPWAMRASAQMVSGINEKDLVAWRSHSQEMSLGLREEIERTPVGELMRSLMAEQVALITSLPTDAAKRVHDLTLAGIDDSRRHKEIVAEIERSGEVTKSRATLIARTETSRTSSLLTQARAAHIGATHYVWETSHDADVRADHKALSGQVFAFADPPVADQHSGARANPGQIFNCRCWARVIINRE